MSRNACSGCTYRNKHGICGKLSYYVPGWNSCRLFTPKTNPAGKPA